MATLVTISFGTPRGIAAINAPGIGAVRTQENFTTPPAVSTNSAADGEIAIVGNSGTSMVAVAFGSTPDAAATTATVATSAGFPLSAGAVVMIPVHAGDKISVKALP